MQFDILGPIEVRGETGPVRLSPKLTCLLAALVSQPNAVVSPERLIDVLWGESPPKSVTKSLHIYAHYLGKALDDGSRLRRSAAGISLSVEQTELDAIRFEQLMRRGRQAIAGGGTERGRALLHEALSLWRGPALAQHDTLPVIREEAARLNRLRQVVTEEWIDAELRSHRHAEVVADLTALVCEFPFRERLRGQLMLALYRILDHMGVRQFENTAGFNGGKK